MIRPNITYLYIFNNQEQEIYQTKTDNVLYGTSHKQLQSLTVNNLLTPSKQTIQHTVKYKTANLTHRQQSSHSLVSQCAAAIGLSVK